MVIPGKKPQPIVEEDSATEETSPTDDPKPMAASNESTEENVDDSAEEINLIFDDEGNEIEEPIQKAEQAKQSKKKTKELSEEEKKKKEDGIRALKDKLAAKISTMKEKRKAPGSKAAGAPSSREAILEERRKKAEARAEKKRKLKEMQGQDGSDDDEESDDDDEDDDEEEVKTEEGVMYQNIVFDDTTRATSDLQNMRVDRKKGPAKKDFKAHLKLIEQKKQKLETMDEDEKKDIAEKDKWNRTFAAADGQKLRDDEKMLKKALKRKEAVKRKSEVEWRDRKDHVEKMITTKVKRREENLAIRKANKGVKRKQQTKQIRKFKTSIAPKRPGFEGRRSTSKKT